MVATPYRTRMDIIVGALGWLGVAVSNQPPETEDILYVDAEIESICRKLEALEIVYLPDRGDPGPSGGSIPAALYDDVTKIIADLVKSKFGLTADDSMKLERDGLGNPPGTGAAAMSLKKMQMGRPTYEILRSEYF